MALDSDCQKSFKNTVTAEYQGIQKSVPGLNRSMIIWNVIQFGKICNQRQKKQKKLPGHPNQDLHNRSIWYPSYINDINIYVKKNSIFYQVYPNKALTFLLLGCCCFCRVRFFFLFLKKTTILCYFMKWKSVPGSGCPS